MEEKKYNKITELKKWSFVLINDKHVFKSQKNKLRPFLVLKNDNYTKEALCIKLATKDSKHLPTLLIERNYNGKKRKSYLYLSQIYNIKYSDINRECERISFIYRHEIIHKIIKYIKKVSFLETPYLHLKNNSKAGQNFTLIYIIKYFFNKQII